MGEGQEALVSKARLITLLNIEGKEPDHDALVEFLNTFVIPRSKIYFGVLLNPLFNDYIIIAILVQIID
jgi:hypothetical protein